MTRFDAEHALVGAILLSIQAYWQVCDTVDADDFADVRLRKLWQVASERIRAGAEADAVTIGDVQPSLGEIAIEVASATPSAANVKAYAEIVAKHALTRRVIAAGQRIASLRGDDALTEAQRIMATLMPKRMASVRSLKACMAEWFTDTADKATREQELVGVPTSIARLDDMTGGLQPSDLIILAARPSVGKTALALQMAIHAARADKPVMFFSAEMSGKQLADRAVSHLGKVNSNDLRRPKTLSQEGWASISSAATLAHKMPLWIDDTAPMTVEGICGRARQKDADTRLGLIVIDYLQHLTLPRSESVTESIQLATRQIKTLAKELSVPIVLLSQLNRDGVTRPSLQHLRGSGAIEQDADVVALLSRPDESNRDRLLLDIAKHRNGECGDIWLDAKLPMMRFTQGSAPECSGVANDGFRRRNAA